jgi:hypothetical protein
MGENHWQFSCPLSNSPFLSLARSRNALMNRSVATTHKTQFLSSPAAVGIVHCLRGGVFSSHFFAAQIIFLSAMAFFRNIDPINNFL